MSTMECQSQMIPHDETKAISNLLNGFWDVATGWAGQLPPNFLAFQNLANTLFVSCHRYIVTGLFFCPIPRISCHCPPPVHSVPGYVSGRFKYRVGRRVYIFFSHEQ